MSDIFMSYAKGDVYKAELLAKRLEEAGFSVFWDRHLLLGPSWEKVVETCLREASCVIVLWSRKSAPLAWVKREADAGAQRNILLPVRISRAKVPEAFSHIDATGLVGWDGNPSHEGFVQLLDAVRSKVARTPTEHAEQADPPQPDPPPPAPETAESAAKQQQPLPVANWGLVEVVEADGPVALQQTLATAPAPPARRTGSKLKFLAATAALIAVGAWASVQWMSKRDAVSVEPVVNIPANEPILDEPVVEQEELVEEPLPRGPKFASDYYEHENGAFQQEGDEWVEYSWDPAAASFNFEEIGRDDNWIYLYDESREIDVALPTGEGFMLVREPGDEDWREHYYLTIPMGARARSLERRVQHSPGPKIDRDAGGPRPAFRALAAKRQIRRSIEREWILAQTA